MAAASSPELNACSLYWAISNRDTPAVIKPWTRAASGPLPSPQTSSGAPARSNRARQRTTPLRLSVSKRSSCHGVVRSMYSRQNMVFNSPSHFAAQAVHFVVGDGPELTLHFLRQGDAE